jgi:predicted esterase
MNKIFKDLSIRIEHHAEVHLPENPKRVFLLLHGYMLDGKYIFDKLKKILPEDCAIVAPIGPFMVPYKKREEYVQRFAWYFFDPKKKVYYIDFGPASEFIKSILLDLDLLNNSITVIGYSQGGYLAPKLSECIPSVDSVIGIACCYRNERFQYKENTKLHQINSEEDLVVDYKSAKEEFDILRSRGNTGQFITLPGGSHKLNDNYIDEVQKLIKQL